MAAVLRIGIPTQATGRQTITLSLTARNGDHTSDNRQLSVMVT